MACARSQPRSPKIKCAKPRRSSAVDQSGTPLPLQFVEKSLGPALADVAIRLQSPNGEIRELGTKRLRRFADGWKIEMPSAEVDMVKTLWLGLPPTQRLRVGGN